MARLYQGRAAERTPTPYATLSVEQGDTELVGGGHRVLQKFMATVAVTTDASPGAAQLAVLATLVGAAADPAAELTLAAGKVVHSRQLPGKGTAVTQVRVDGKDLWQATTRLEILVSTLRG